MGENPTLVQVNRGKLRTRIDRLRSIFRRRKILHFPLDFQVELDDHGNHVIEIYADIEGEKNRINDVKALWQHGFSIQRNNKAYFMTNDDYETLLSLRALNPTITEDGKIISQVNPTVLKYLRSKNQVKESEDSKKLTIHETPPERRAEIHYEAGKGLVITTGYGLPGSNETIPKSALEPTPDGEYIRVGNSFFPAPEEKSPQVREWIEAERIYVGTDDIPEFFKRDLVLIKSNFKALLTEEAESLTIVEQGFQPRVTVDTGEKGWLDFVVEYQVGKYILDINLLKRSQKGYVRVDNTTWVKVDTQKIDETNMNLESLGATPTEDGFRLEITKFLSLEEFIAKIGGMKEVSAEYQRFLDEITDFSYNEQFRLPDNVEAEILSSGIKLRGYQRAGIHWLCWLTRHYLHGILADDMGLGKTIQMSIAMRLAYEQSGQKNHSLIIAPRSVVTHWHREIDRVFPSARIYDYHGPRRTQRAFNRQEPHFFITTYATSVNDIDILRTVPFFFVILDEGTSIKNPETRRAKAVKQLNSGHRFVLSGTPIENRPAELWSILDFLMRGHLGTYGGFISRFENPIMKGEAASAEFLSKRIRPFILRRMKEQVAKDLPEKINMNESCGLTEEQKSLYGQLQDLHVTPIRRSLERGEYVSYTTSILPIITKLKQVCDHPALLTGKKEPLLGRSEKFDFVIKKLQRIIGNEESVVIFTHFLGTLDLFEQHLQQQQLSYIRIDGSTTNRQQLIDRFNNREMSVALCSIMAAGHGINLIAANHVIHVDRWWNPAVEDQATDRVHRIGQVKTVYVHRIITDGTLEEKIDLLIEKKRGISDKVIGAATQGELKWTREELLEILEPIPI
jgi:SNF2 family DNA or RNA helicase